MVFQSYALFPHLTVRENIAFGLVVREEPKRVVRRTGRGGVGARRGASTSSSGGPTSSPAASASGSRSRGRSCAGPDAFLLDEPLSNLDAGTRVEMRTELRRLHREIGSTMVHVTHDQVEALTLGDRVAVLDAGRVRQVGTPDEVYSRPRDRFVAGVPRHAGDELPRARRRRGGSTRSRTGPSLGVRPEHVRLEPGGVADSGRPRRGGGERCLRPPRPRPRRASLGRRPAGRGRRSGRRLRPWRRASLRRGDRRARGSGSERATPDRPDARRRTSSGLAALVAAPALVTFGLAFTEYDLIRPPELNRPRQLPGAPGRRDLRDRR